MGNKTEPTPTDEQLLQRYLDDPAGRSGRQAADQLLGRYQGRVFQWCRGYTRNPDDALDLAQEILVNAFKGLKNFEGQAKFSSWLFAIARNRCLTAVRLAREPALPLDEIAELRDRGQNAEDLLRQRQADEALRLLLGRDLDPREEEAFWLRVVEKMSVDQITRVLRLENPSGARSVLQKARRKLRKIWGDRIDDFKGVD